MFYAFFSLLLSYCVWVVLFGSPHCFCCIFMVGLGLTLVPGGLHAWVFSVRAGHAHVREYGVHCLKAIKNLGLLAHYCWIRRRWIYLAPRASSPTPPGPYWRTWSFAVHRFPQMGGGFCVLFLARRISCRHLARFEQCCIFSIFLVVGCWSFSLLPPHVYPRLPLLAGRVLKRDA